MPTRHAALKVVPYLRQLCLSSALIYSFFNSSNTSVQAANPGITWDGGGGDVNWSSGANWDGTGGQPVPTNLTFIVMAGATRLTNNADAGGGAMVNLTGLKISNDVTASFVIYGSALTNAAGGIINMRAGQQTISNRFELVAAQTITNSGGTLLFAGTLTNYGNQIQLNSGANIRFTSSLEGSGSFVKNGGGTNSIEATTTFTGDFTNNAGLVIVSANGALGGTVGKTVVASGATVEFSNGINYATAEFIQINGTGVNGLGAIDNGNGNNTFAGPITLLSDSRIGTESGNLTLSGAITNGGSQLSFTNLTGTILTISGVISGAGGLIHSGVGTTVLNSNSFTGTSVTNLSGTLQINHNLGLGAATSYVVSGGTLLYNANSTNTAATVSMEGGTFSETDNNLSLGTLSVKSSSIISLASGGASVNLLFTSATNTVGSGAKLTIYGWSWNTSFTAGSDDLIFFTTTTGVTSSFLDNVTFFGTGGGARLLSTGELVPITPEPSTTILGLFLMLFFGQKFLSPIIFFIKKQRRGS